jgi:hypothetical protein
LTNEDLDEIDVALITHFHLDHCAAVPYLLCHTTFKVCSCGSSAVDTSRRVMSLQDHFNLRLAVDITTLLKSQTKTQSRIACFRAACLLRRHSTPARVLLLVALCSLRTWHGIAPAPAEQSGAAPSTTHTHLLCLLPFLLLPPLPPPSRAAPS